MTKQTMRVRNEKEIETASAMLVLNGYTVCVTTVKKANSNTKKKVLEYWDKEEEK